MKKISLFMILFLGQFCASNAQINMIKNPSLEEFHQCPYSGDQIIYAKYWSPTWDTFPYSVDSLGSEMCSAEYCNECSAFTIATIPYNGNFYHYARTGKGAAQVMMFTNSGYADYSIPAYFRDYLQGRLYATLQAGHSYSVSFYVVLEQASAWAINHIGAYLDNGTIDTFHSSTTSYSSCGMQHPSIIPQIVTDSIISDSLNWTKIEGTFTATGTERFITIGNFYDSAHTAKSWTNFDLAAGMFNDVYTWYLVDDVSVIACDDTANAGIDRAIPLSTSDSVWVGDTTGYLPCYWYRHVVGTAGWVLIDSNTAGFKVHPDTTTSYVMQLNVCGHITTDTMTVWVGPVSVRGSRAGAEVALYPNPAGSEVTVEGVRGCEVRVIDMVGRCLITYNCSEDMVRLPLAGLEKGMYFVELTDEETGCKVVRKMVKE